MNTIFKWESGCWEIWNSKTYERKVRNFCSKKIHYFTKFLFPFQKLNKKTVHGWGPLIKLLKWLSNPLSILTNKYFNGGLEYQGFNNFYYLWILWAQSMHITFLNASFFFKHLAFKFYIAFEVTHLNNLHTPFRQFLYSLLF